MELLPHSDAYYSDSNFLTLLLKVNLHDHDSSKDATVQFRNIISKILSAFPAARETKHAMHDRHQFILSKSTIADILMQGRITKQPDSNGIERVGNYLEEYMEYKL